MPESDVHATLVRSLMRRIADEYLNGDIGSICHDSAGRRASSAPPKIEGFIPDVFVPSMSGLPVIVGEAKTVRDLDTMHSRGQITAFLAYCEGQLNSVFVLAVPWHAVPYGRSLIRQVCKKNGLVRTRFSVLEFLPG